MKNWLRNCRILAICLVAFFLLDTGLTVQAAPPDTGTFKIKLKEQEHDVQIAMYKVADYKNGNYEVLPEFSDGKVNLNEIKNASELEQCATKLFDVATSKKIDPIFQDVIKGSKDFGEMPIGMYLIAQVEREDERLKITPFLVGIPYWEVEIGPDGTENKTLTYDVVSYPKEEKIAPKPEPEPEKPEPTPSIKTGDVNSEQIMLYLAVLLVAAVAAFKIGKKRAYR